MKAIEREIIEFSILKELLIEPKEQEEQEEKEIMLKNILIL